MVTQSDFVMCQVGGNIYPRAILVFLIMQIDFDFCILSGYFCLELFFDELEHLGLTQNKIQNKCVGCTYFFKSMKKYTYKLFLNGVLEP